jgi:hypothetical protein
MHVNHTEALELTGWFVKEKGHPIVSGIPSSMIIESETI